MKRTLQLSKKTKHSNFRSSLTTFATTFDAGCRCVWAYGVDCRVQTFTTILTLWADRFNFFESCRMMFLVISSFLLHHRFRLSTTPCRISRKQQGFCSSKAVLSPILDLIQSLSPIRSNLKITQFRLNINQFLLP